MASDQPWHQCINEQPQIGALDRVVHFTQIRNQILGQQRLKPHVGLGHHVHIAVDVRRFVVSHCRALGFVDVVS